MPVSHATHPVYLRQRRYVVAEGRDVAQLEGDDAQMIRKLASGEYRLYSRKKDKTGRRRNLGTFKTRSAAEKHERAVQYFKRHG
jgi:hypothetical protein